MYAQASNEAPNGLCGQESPETATPIGPPLPTTLGSWVFPLLRVALIFAPGSSPGMSPDTGTAGPAPRGSRRPDDAYIAGDVTPLAAKVSGYVKTVAVNDYQAVQKGDLIVEIEPSDYRRSAGAGRASRAPRRRPRSPISPIRRTCSAR